MINIGLLGLGTVGGGVYDIISTRENLIKKLTGEKVRIKKVLVKDLNKERDINIKRDLLTINPNDILEDPEINLVVEVLNEKEDAYLYIKSAIKNKKHVITANKAVVAWKMAELIRLAEENNRAFLFEASVGGGVPIIKPLKEYTNIDKITEIQGILNGTTNYILTQMFDRDLNFIDALKEAQDLGYAELNPTDDIEGYDSLRKLYILSTIGFQRNINMKSIRCQGITGITLDDIQMFKKIDYVPKLLAKSQHLDDRISISVEPVLVRKDSMYSNVKDAFNIISIKGNNIIGELKFYGEGAGRNPTAYSIFTDILDIVNSSYNNNRVYIDENKEDEYELFSGKYYLRVNVKEEGSITNVLNVLDKNKLKFKVVDQSGNLFIITDYTEGEIVSKIINIINRDLKKEYFYSRIQDN